MKRIESNLFVLVTNFLLLIATSFLLVLDIKDNLAGPSALFGFILAINIITIYLTFRNSSLKKPQTFRQTIEEHQDCGSLGYYPPEDKYIECSYPFFHEGIHFHAESGLVWIKSNDVVSVVTLQEIQ